MNGVIWLAEIRSGHGILIYSAWHWLIVLRFNDMSTLVGHFVSFSRGKEKRKFRRDNTDEREGQGRRRKMNESEETKE